MEGLRGQEEMAAGETGVGSEAGMWEIRRGAGVAENGVAEVYLFCGVCKVEEGKAEGEEADEGGDATSASQRNSGSRG